MSLNVALLGCGAIAQAFYLPALARNRKQFNEIWLVDPNEKTLTTASSMVSARTAKRFEDVSSRINYTIVAAPNSLHAPLALAALSRGSHVLIEKPFALSPEDGHMLVDTASRVGRLLAVNQTRRFLPYIEDLRRRIAANEFGSLDSVVHREGYKLSWPFESGAAFARTSKRTGVIMDFGVHVIDFYEYLLEPKWTFVSAIHDGFSGPEGLAEIRVQADSTLVEIRLSRYQKQDNIARLRFRRAEIIVNLDNLNGYDIKRDDRGVRHVSADVPTPSYTALADQVIANFISAPGGQVPLRCSATSSLPVIAVLDEIYRSAETYPVTVGVV